MTYNPNSLAQRTALRNEIQNDPRAYGYAAFVSTGDDSDVAATLNTVRDGTNGAAISVKRSDVTPNEILEQTDSRDFVANPTPLLAAWYQALCTQRSIRLLNDDGSSTRVIANLNRLLGNAQASQTRLAAIATRNGSRAEELWGTGSFISADDIAGALRG